MIFHFCTYFDINYLPRALCLIDSLTKQCEDFTLFTLCHDDESFNKVKTLNHNIIPINISELENKFKILLKIKKERSKVEYFYTCGPLFIRHVIGLNPYIKIITYLDADLYFYSSPKILYKSFENYSIGAIPHNLPENRSKKSWSGIYNVGWLNFRNDVDGLKCLERWRDQCLEWCFEKKEGNKYADQLYLDEWPNTFNSFYEFSHCGANLAPWNIKDYNVTFKSDKVFINNDPLIFFHFHGLKKISKHIYKTNFGTYKSFLGKVFKKKILEEYLNKLEYYSNHKNPTKSIRKYKPRYAFLSTIIKTIFGLVFKEYVLFVKNKVYGFIFFLLINDLLFKNLL